MPNTRELRRRIRSVKNTAQITKAMQMVAATKMRKAQAQALSGRPYNITLNQAMAMLLPRIQENRHPLLNEHGQGKTAVLMLSTDKSLCGSLNTNLFRTCLNFSKEHKDLMFYTVGRKGRQFVVKSGFDLIADFENSDLVNFRMASQIAKLVTEAFLNHEIKELLIIYPDFVSALRQDPKIVRILPVDYKNLIETLSPELQNQPSKKPYNLKPTTSNLTSEFKFEPNLDELPIAQKLVFVLFALLLSMQ